MGELVGVALGLRPGEVVPVAGVHLDPADLGRPVEPKGDEKLVQQAGMIIVAGILGIELPVPSYPLTIVSRHPDRPVEQASQLRQDRCPEIFLERLGILGERAEQRPVDVADPQRAQTVGSHVEAIVEPALAPDAAAKRDRRQAAVEPVAPLVIDADMLFGVAGELAPHQRAAMGAAVDKGLHRPRLVPVEDDRGLADIARPEIPRVGDFGIETEKAPDGPAEDPLLLTRIDLGIVIEAVGHPAVIERRPNRSGYHLPGPLVLVVFALATARAQLRLHGRSSGVQFGMSVESGLVGPALQQSQPVWIERALKDLELLAARFFHALLAARSVYLRELGTLSRCGGDRDNESDCHIVSSARQLIERTKQYDPRRRPSRTALCGAARV